VPVRRGDLEENSKVVLDEVGKAVRVGGDAQGDEIVDTVVDSLAAASKLRSAVLAGPASGVVEEPVSHCFDGCGGWRFGVEEHLVGDELFI
jgi:hypothetical protein